jgi:hypothetical protein
MVIIGGFEPLDLGSIPNTAFTILCIGKIDYENDNN